MDGPVAVNTPGVFWTPGEIGSRSIALGNPPTPIFGTNGPPYPPYPPGNPWDIPTPVLIPVRTPGTNPGPTTGATIDVVVV